MTEELASRWSRLQARVAHCITVGSAPDDRNSSGMRCKNLREEVKTISLFDFLPFIPILHDKWLRLNHLKVFFTNKTVCNFTVLIFM